MKVTAGRIVLFLILTGLIGRATSAYAQAVPVGYWTTNGAGCTAGDPAVQNNRYLVSGGSVKHQSANADLITLYCPITNPALGVVNHLRVTYQDNDNTNTGTPTDVTASVVGMNPADGSLTTYLTLSSSSYTATTGTGVQHDVGLPSGQYFSNVLIYYLRVDIQRHSTSSTCVGGPAGGTTCVAIFYGAEVLSE